MKFHVRVCSQLAIVLCLVLMHNKCGIVAASFPSTSTPNPRFGYQNVLQTAPLKQSTHKPELLVQIGDWEESQQEIQTTPTQYSSSEETGRYRDLSSEEEGEEEREVLCPATTQDFRYDNETENCYEIGTKARCGLNMAFQNEEDNFVFGLCDCNISSIVPLVFHRKSNACFPVYDQAYCSKGEWLVIDRQLKPDCVPRTCKMSKAKTTSKVPLNGDGPCVQLNASSKFCEPEEIVLFAPETVVPTCQRNSSLTLPRVLAASSAKCSPGSFRSQTGKCVSGWSWSV